MADQNKIKVLHVLHAVGGVDISLRLLTKSIDYEVFENIIVKGRADSSQQYKNKLGKPLKIYKLPIKREINFLDDLRSIIKLVKILNNEKPSIVHAHSAKGGIIARLASLFYKVNVLHTPQAYSYLSTTIKFKRAFFLFIESSCAKMKNSYLLACSNSEKERGLKEVGYKPNKVLLFNNSVLPINIDIIKGEKLQFPENYICTVGRPSYQKNIEMLVRIIRDAKESLPNIHLVVMGLGVVSPNTENIKQLIVDYKLKDNVTLIEWIERDRILQIIKASKFYISTARYEGLPYAIIESLALNKAVIASDCDGNRDLVIDDYNGCLIDLQDEERFVKEVINLSSDEKKRSAFEANSFELFNKKFNLSKNISDLERIYMSKLA